MVVQNGQSIISGWSDGKIRAFGPQSGKLLYTIHDAHQGAVTAISGTPDSTRIISGGEEGMVRMWAIHPHSQVMQASMKVSCALTGLPRAVLCCLTNTGMQTWSSSAGHAVLLHNHGSRVKSTPADHAVLPDCLHAGHAMLVPSHAEAGHVGCLLIVHMPASPLVCLSREWYRGRNAVAVAFA